MTRLRVISLCGMLLLLMAASPVRAGSIELQPSTAVPAEDDLVEILVLGVGFPDGADGGDFAIAWSPNLAFVSLTIEDPPWDLSRFEATQSSVDYVDVFSLLETPGVGGATFRIATLTLRAAAAGAAYVSLRQNLVGWSLAGDSIDTLLGPEARLEVTPVPEPGCDVLAGLSIALLGRMARRARAMGSKRR